jgi:hypothetical protein
MNVPVSTKHGKFNISPSRSSLRRSHCNSIQKLSDANIIADLTQKLEQVSQWNKKLNTMVADHIKANFLTTNELVKTKEALTAMTTKCVRLTDVNYIQAEKLKAKKLEAKKLAISHI